jgi:hypothetical protein
MARKAGVRVDDSKHLFCVSLAMRAFADVHPSLLLLVHLGHIAPALTTLSHPLEKRPSASGSRDDCGHRRGCSYAASPASANRELPLEPLRTGELA